MIIYGWNTKNIKQAPLEDYECPVCGQKQSVLAIFGHYAHVFWIPFFPYKKSAHVVCTHCQLDTPEKQLDASKKAIVKQLKSSVSFPKYMFSGLIILVMGIAFIMYSSRQDKAKEASLLSSPQVGDVYVMKDLKATDEYDHYLMKVNDIAGDSLWVSFNSYGYNGVVSSLDPKDGFFDVMYSMHKNALKDYQESGELKKVIRDYTASAGFDRVIYEGIATPDSVGVE